MNARDRFIREKERRALTGVSRTTAWRLEREGKFPPHYKLSSGGKTGAIGWKLSEIEKWIAERCEVKAA